MTDRKTSRQLIEMIMEPAVGSAPPDFEKYGEISDLETIAMDFQREKLREVLQAMIEISGKAAAQREIKDACAALGIKGSGKRGPRVKDDLPAIKRLAREYVRNPDASQLDLALEAEVAESDVSKYRRDKRFHIEVMRLRDRQRRKMG